MIKRKGEMKKVDRPNVRGGNGTVKALNIFEKDEMKDAFLYFSELSLDPGVSIGMYPHKEDAEVYYILEGKLLLIEDGVESTVEEGDAVIKSDGSSHSIENNTEKKARILAVMSKKMV